jgi:SAM-dependent methyltransferase
MPAPGLMPGHTEKSSQSAAGRGLYWTDEARTDCLGLLFNPEYNMGYALDYFGAEVEQWFEKGWLAAGLRLIEFGGQEFYGDQDEARRNVAAFLRRREVPQERIAAALGSGGKVSVAAVYQALGVNHSSIDADEKYDAIFFDLNSFAPPMEWRSAFDFVNNEGTIEHLINPINGFQVAHELLKVGGVARHSIPLTGFRDHGLIYPTVKFYAQMLGYNRYELLRSDIFVKQSKMDLGDPRFRWLTEDGKPLANGIELTDAWLCLIYRKTRAAEFRVPFDHLNVTDTETLGERLSGTFSAYSRMRLTASQKRDPIGDAFERRIELVRRGDNVAFVAALLAIALNGAALVYTLEAPGSHSRIAFAIGLILAFVPAAVLTRFSPQTGRKALAARLAMRLLWFGSAAAFIYGCFSG